MFTLCKFETVCRRAHNAFMESLNAVPQEQRQCKRQTVLMQGSSFAWTIGSRIT